MNVHILVTTLVLVFFVLSVFDFRGALKLLKLNNEVKIKEGRKLLFYCYRYWLFSAMIILPFSFSRVLPITYYLFENNGVLKGLEWYLVLHITLLAVAVYGMFSMDSIARSLKLNIDLLGFSMKEITIWRGYLVAVWTVLVLWLIVGMQYSLFESNQPSPQALVTYSPLRFLHWISVVSYVTTTLLIFFYIPTTRRKFKWWLIPMTTLFLVLLWSSSENISNSLLTGCYTLWCK